MRFYNKNYPTTISDGLAPAPAAQARHLSYTLLSQLFLQGLTPESLPTVQAVPELAELLPEPLDLDELAAVHYQLFGFNVFPFASIFLDDSGLLGGPVTDAVSLDYQLAGFHVAAEASSPDHIGQELAFLAFLCQLEWNALQNARDVAAVQGQQILFLQKHLLHWLIPLTLAIKQQDDPFFTAVSNLTLALVYDHYQALANEHEIAVAAWVLPTAPDLLDDDKTSLKDIAVYFTTPVYGGVFLSRDDVGRLARQYKLPRGFGDRQQLLTNLMRTAVQYDQFSGILNAVKQVVIDWQSFYAGKSKEMPLLEPFIQPWQQRTMQTIHLIANMANAVEIAE